MEGKPVKPAADRRYTCNDYREEMRLLGLKRRLEEPDLPEEERVRIEAEIRDLERRMGMD